jgi:hypothetical protein
MSYADPSKIRKHRVTIYLNDSEQVLVEAVKNFEGGELAPMLRDMMLEGLRRVLHGEHGALTSQGSEGVLRQQISA